MKSHACEPCARRKVKCNREEPCSNCNRRKQDQCVYVELSATDRIKELEALVRKLQSQNTAPGSPNHGGPRDAQAKGNTARIGSLPDGPISQNGTDSMMLKEDGQGEAVYVESFSWHNWNGSALQEGEGQVTTVLTSRMGSSALQSIICRNESIDLSKSHPLFEIATLLWKTFVQRVHPVWMVSFKQELNLLRDKALGANGYAKLTFAEHAFIFALYIITVTSLADDECLDLLYHPKDVLLKKYQALCEQALAGSDVLGSSDVLVIEAAIMYIWAGLLEQMNARSLWSFMGAIMRNAERLGLHRDGTVFQLSPYETEKRRRLWWQLQHLDIALAVRAGSISLTLSARWDTKLPLNIEDGDINPEMTTPPEERPGLTSISYCLWTFWVLQEQRAFRHPDGRYLGFGWIAERSLSRDAKNGYIDRLEAGLNKQYVQYCDPIKPLDVLIQITARAFVCGMRRVSMYGDLSQMSEQARRQLLDVCMQGVEYDIALHATPAIKQFRPLFRGYFQWNALAYVLLEARRLPYDPITAKIWELLADLYTSNPGLSQNLVDRRKSYAIELTSAAWKARAGFLHQQQLERGTTRSIRKPAFLVGLEKTLDEFNETTKDGSSSKRKLEELGEVYVSTTKKHVAMPDDGLPSEGIDFNQLDPDLVNDFNFDAIDWSFWEMAQ